MVRITTQYYKSENLTFSYGVNVDKDGKFTTTLPDDIAEKFLATGIDLAKNRLYNSGYFSANSLAELNAQVKETADKYSEKQLIGTKIIIRYAVDTTCHYCKGKDGTIYPDGTWQKKAEGGGEQDYNWREGTKERFSQSKDPFGFEVAFKLYTAKVWKFPNGEVKTEYIHFNDTDARDDELLRWLASVRRMGFLGSTEREIEYSPEVGLFFKNMVLYVCNINEKIKSTFGEQFDLSKVDINKLSQLGFKGD